MTREKSWRGVPRHHYGLYKKKRWKMSKLYIRSENMNSRPAINIDDSKRDILQERRVYIVTKIVLSTFRERIVDILY